jgi:hypothetical protein
MSVLHDETRRWLDASGLWESVPLDGADVQQTRTAFAARRNAAQPFGEYEFALRTPVEPPFRLTATDWENALKTPAFVWMKHRLGVEPRDESDETPWNLAIGHWVHRWLGPMAGNTHAFSPLPRPAEALAMVRARARAFWEGVAGILRTRDRALPDWWLSTWQQALDFAERLAQQMAAAPACTHLATEWPIENTAIPIDDGAPLFLRGRIDLILTPESPPASALPGEAWIVDYKTGNRKSLDPGSGDEATEALAKRFRRGDGLQLALYALALHQLGARSVGVSVLTPALELDRPQLTLDDLEVQGPIWCGLRHMQESGAFGMRGRLRDEFAFRGDYPLATLAIDEDVLAEKWERTHRELSDGEDEA